MLHPPPLDPLSLVPLSLDPLEGFSGLLSAGFFALYSARVTREQPRSLKRRPEPWIEVLQGSADAVPHRL